MNQFYELLNSPSLHMMIGNFQLCLKRRFTFRISFNLNRAKTENKVKNSLNICTNIFQIETIIMININCQKNSFFSVLYYKNTNSLQPPLFIWCWDTCGSCLIVLGFIRIFSRNSQKKKKKSKKRNSRLI